MDQPDPTENDPLLGNRFTGLLDVAMGTALAHSEAQVPDHWEPPSPAHIALLLPQYEIEHLIGRGGMGAVYKGRQITLNRPVAIKVLPAELAKNTEFVARFHREAQVLASLSHPGIVMIYDFGQTSEGHLYFVMEYVSGTDLHKLIHKSDIKISPATALHLTIQICEAMQYAHDKGVVHRDVKPANVLITKDHRPKLADFGLAMKPSDHSLDAPEWASASEFDPTDPLGVAALRLTKPGDAMGTPDYAAPEVYEGKADQRSDIYALGIMLYEMLTGAPPRGYYQLPSTKASVDHRVDDLVIKALEPDPSARFQQANEMKLAAQQATTPLRQQPPVAPTPPAVQTTPAPARVIFRPSSTNTSPRHRSGAPARRSLTARLLLGTSCLVALGLTYDSTRQWSHSRHCLNIIRQLKQSLQALTIAPAKSSISPTPISSASPAPATTEGVVPTEVAAPIPKTAPPPGYTRVQTYPMFNGKDLTGWAGLPQFWSAENGTITARTTATVRPKGFTSLIWKGGVADFELSLRFKISGGDSTAWRVPGIQFRARMDHPKNFSLKGYNAELDYDHRWTGGLCEKSARNITAPRGKKVTIRSAANQSQPDCVETGTIAAGDELRRLIKVGDWNDYQIVAAGKHIQIFVNGVPMCHVIDESKEGARSGLLGLSIYYESIMTVQFRDLWFTELRPASNTDTSALESALLSSDWTFYNRATSGGQWHWDITFFANNVAKTHDKNGYLRTWHWWITGPRTIHVQTGAEPSTFDRNIGFDWTFDEALTSYQGERTDKTQFQSGDRKGTSSAGLPILN